MRFRYTVKEEGSDQQKYLEAGKRTSEDIDSFLMKEYKKLCKQGKLPKGLPYAPNEVYAKERMNKLIIK